MPHKKITACWHLATFLSQSSIAKSNQCWSDLTLNTTECTGLRLFHPALRKKVIQRFFLANRSDVGLSIPCCNCLGAWIRAVVYWKRECSLTRGSQSHFTLAGLRVAGKICLPCCGGSKQGLVADPGQFGGIFILCHSQGATGDPSQRPGFGVPDSKGSYVLPRVSSSPCHILGVP